MPLIESFEPEDTSVKETFAFFGRAMYYAQVLEQELLLLAVTLHLSGRTKITRPDVEQLFSCFEPKTFGQLLREASKLICVPSDLQARLDESVKKRNYLAHSFFDRHAEDFMSDRGRADMIEELRGLISLFAEVDISVTEIRSPLSAKLGVTEEVAAKLLKEMTERAKRRDEEE